MALLAAWPDLFNPLFGLFNFQRGGGQRLLGVVLIANLILLALVLRNLGQSDLVSRDMRLLIEALGMQSFDEAKAANLPNGDRIVVVLPAHNEGQNVGTVVRSMPKRIDGLPVVTLVVDDASTDETSRVSEEAGALVARLPVRRGGGLALRVGYEIALKLGGVVIASMDADGQHLPEEISVMIAPILAGEADYVNGSRLLGTFERESLIRHLGVHVFSRIITILTGQRITRRDIERPAPISWRKWS